MKESLDVLFSRLNAQQIFALGGVAMAIHANPQNTDLLRKEAFSTGLFETDELDCFFEIMRAVY